MSRALNLADRAVVALARVAGGIAALLLLASALAIFAGIVTRSLGIPLAWPTDIVPHFLLLAVMLAAAEAFRRGEHIAVDLLVSRARPGMGRVVTLWGSATVILLAALLILQGLEMIAFSRMVGMRTHDRLDFPIWWVQCAVPLGGALLGLASLRSFLAALVGRETGAGGGAGMGVE